MSSTDTLTVTSTWRAAGVTDDITTCEHCGREGLKRTVRMVLTDPDGGVEGETYMGTTCAARMTGRLVKEITTEARRADKARRDVLNKAHADWSSARSNAFCSRRDAALGPDFHPFAELVAWQDSPEEVAAAAAWLAANPEPENPWT